MNLIISIVVISAVILYLLTMLVITKAYTVRFIQQFGRQVSVKQPGLSIKMPWPFQTVAGDLSTAVQFFEREVQIITKDRAVLSAKVIVQYEVISDGGDEKLELAFYKLRNREQQLGAYIENEAKSASNGMSMEQLFESKDTIEQAIKAALTDLLGGYGYRVVNAQLIEPEPSDGLKAEFDNVLASEQRKRAATNDAEAKKRLMIGEAQAESESVAIKVDTFRTKREAIASTIVDIAETLKPAGIDADRALAYLEGIDWRDTVRDSSNMVILPADFGGSGNNPSTEQVIALQVALKKALEKK